MIEIIFFVIGLVVLIGFAANVAFVRTKVPEALFLIAAGVVLGPGLGVVSQAVAMQYASLVTAIMLIVVMLDNGLEFNIFRIVRALPLTVAYAVGVMATTAAVMTAVLHWALGLPLLPAAIIAFAMAGTTTDVITAITAKMRMGHDGKQLLAIESVINDIQIVPFFILLHYAQTASVNHLAAINAVVVQIPVAIGVGVGASILWIVFIGRVLGRHPLNYVATIGILFMVYNTIQLIGGNGAIAVLAFSLVLGNAPGVFDHLHAGKRLRRKFTDAVIKDVKQIEEDISFFVRVVFFVFLGIVFSFSVLQGLYIATTVALVGATLAVRYGAVRLLVRRMKVYRHDVGPLTWIMPRGYVAAVLAFAALSSGLFSPDVVNLVLLFIFATTGLAIAYATVWEWRKPHGMLGETEAWRAQGPSSERAFGRSATAKRRQSSAS